ncbi:MAG: hypothetical protein KDA98_16200 [Acidimicrobiales bacterium]|nr:hypothetical protein [Acidimicrobiales bacterium]
MNGILRDVAERSQGWVRLIDATDQLCDADGGALTETPDGDPLRQDGAHFDPPAATWFWNQWLAGQVAAAYSTSGP